MPATAWGGLGAAVDTLPTTLGGVVTAAWGGFTVTAVGDDLISVTVYDAATGRTFLAAAAESKAQYRVELSKVGTMNVSVPLTDPIVPHLVDRAVVKCSWRGVTEGGRVSGETCSLALDGNRWLTVAMPTLLGVLHDGPIYPQGGLVGGVIDKNAPTTRTFGPMSPQGPWYHAADWSFPLGTLMSADPTKRQGFPVELKAQDPYWIAPSPGPDVDQAAGAVVHFRHKRSVSVVTDCEAVFTADNYLSLWVDGQEIISPDYTGSYTWKQVYSQKFTLQPGVHTVYARVENAFRSTGQNPLGLCGVIYTLDKNGNRNTVPLTITDPVHWLATSATVGYLPGQVLHQVMTESQLVGDAGPSMLALTFTPTHDSAGVAWSGTRGVFEYNVMTDKIDDVVGKLSENGLDVVVDAVAMTLNAYQRLGVDRSGSVALKLGGTDVAANLLQFDTATQSTRFTVAVAQLADGKWHTVEDTAGVAAVGRVVEAVQLGTTSSPEAATVTMQQMLAQSAKPVLSATAQTSSLVGPQVDRDYFLGDSITTPDGRGVSTVKQRVYAKNVDGSSERVKAWPELIIDPS